MTKTSTPSSRSAARAVTPTTPELGKNNKTGGGSKPPPIRPGNVQAELEALRQKGLATLLNKHFTTEIQKLAHEKAAADAALLDLQQRKAATSEFQASGDGAGISPFEELFMKVNKWRKECRDKERETLLLYQRYVAKFGSSGVPIQVPGVSNRPGSPSVGGAALQSPNVMLVPSSGGGRDQASSGTKSPSDSSNGSTPTLWAAAPPPTESPPSNGRRPGLASPTKVQVNSMAAAIEQSLDEYVREGAMALPSMELLGKDSNFSQHAKTQDAEFRNFYRRQLESKGVDAKANDEFLHKGEIEYPTPFLKYAKNSPVGVDVTEYGEDEDDYSGEGQDGLGPLYIHHSEDDDSVVSGLTFNSALTREIMDDCERTVVTFLREEKEAIRKMMMQEEEEGDALTAKSVLSQIGSACNEAAAQAENMVQQMQEILTKFQDDSVADVGTVTKEARKFETRNPNENWMVYYDEYYQREYYHELNTNRTQWEPPMIDDTSVSGHGSVASRSAPLLSSQEVMPEIHHSAPNLTSTTSRIELYRRKRRRQRKRRLAAVVLLLVVLGIAAYQYYYGASPPTEATDSSSIALTLAMPMMMWARVESTLHTLTYTLLTSKTQREKEEAERREAERRSELETEEKARAELMAQREKEEARKEQERLEREAARKAQAEAERNARDELVRKAKEEAVKAQELLERLKREQAAREALDYRVGGRVPMAYFVEDIPLVVKFGSS
jgi:hypothetical protein